MLVTVERPPRSTRPIAGTRPRGATPRRTHRHRRGAARRPQGARRARDARRPRPQRPRPRREYGTVRVDDVHGRRDLLARHAHRLATSRARCAEDVGAIDALRATFPAGTLSGAPKVRAMEIIDELEPVKRGGLRRRDRLPSLLRRPRHLHHIRTVVVKDGVAAHPGRRAASSPTPIPRLEFEETRAKARGASCARSPLAPRQQPAMAREGPRHRQLRLVHLQPGPVLGELGRELEVVRNDAPTVDDLLAREPDASSVARARPPGGRRDLLEVVRRFPEARGADRSASASATSRWRRRSAATSSAHEPDARQDDRDHATTGARSSRACPTRSTATRYHSLVVDAESLPDRARGQRRADEATSWASRHRELPAEGVQFHPESVLTPEGGTMLRELPRARACDSELRASRRPLDARRVAAATSARRRRRDVLGRDHGRRGRARRRSPALLIAPAHEGRDASSEIAGARLRRCASSPRR